MEDLTCSRKFIEANALSHRSYTGNPFLSCQSHSRSPPLIPEFLPWLPKIAYCDYYQLLPYLFKLKSVYLQGKMLPLLYTLVFVEMAVSLTLLFKTPLRSLVVMCLDAVKRGKGLIMAESVAGTLFVVLISSVYSIITIKKRSIDAGAVTPTDQVLLANHILEVTLMGNSTFLR